MPIGKQIQSFVATQAEWAASNEILASNYCTVESDTGKMKLGDGIRTWNELAYMSEDAKIETYDAILLQTTPEDPVDIIESPLNTIKGITWTRVDNVTWEGKSPTSAFHLGGTYLQVSGIGGEIGAIPAGKHQDEETVLIIAVQVNQPGVSTLEGEVYVHVEVWPTTS